ncbi:MAG TPA: ATP-binding protein [Syntrophorhabdaceae bacterium]|nr:ATP-binding protein [Syntrophorhabdaceae bacterium]
MHLTDKKGLFHFTRSKKSLIALLILSILFISATIVLTTSQNLISVRAAANRSLDNLATALSLSAESFLRDKSNPDYEEINRLFPDRIVAYAVIANREGKIVFHTNRALIGATAPDKEYINKALLSQQPTGFRTTLGTGIPAYKFFYPLKLPENRQRVLEIVLNSSSSEKVLAETRQVWWIVCTVLGIVWTIGFILGWAVISYGRVQQELEERKRMALIGQMTSVLAHEIRNAVGGIKGFAQWLDEKTDTADMRKSGLGMILKGTNRIEGLVNNLLLYSRPESYNPTEFNLNALVRETIDPRSTKWEGRLILGVDPDIRIVADRDKLQRVLLNAVRNAIDSMGPDGELIISHEKKRHSAVISIKDTGKGISKEDASRIFTPFFTTRTDGTGLGLAYSRKVIEGMGGHINLNNRKDRSGAVLTIELPGRIQSHE